MTKKDYEQEMSFLRGCIGSIQLKSCRKLSSRSSLNSRRNLVVNLLPGMSER